MESRTKLLDQMRLAPSRRYLSQRTEQAYISWSRRFILFHQKRHPKEMGAPEIRAFLAHLAVHDQVAASTQNGASRMPSRFYTVMSSNCAFPDLDTLNGPTPASSPYRLDP